jgi:RNA polymerase sigma-70 factor (sigma-E family)
VRRADDSDFTEFVAGSSRRLLGLAYLLTGDKQSAQESLQAALERTYRHWRRLSREGAPEDYVRRILVNAASGRRRGPKAKVPLDLLRVSAPPAAGDDEAAARTALMRAVDTLPSSQRAMLILRHFAVLSDEQAAAVLGCSVGAAKGQYARAIARLESLSPSRGTR